MFYAVFGKKEHVQFWELNVINDCYWAAQVQREYDPLTSTEWNVFLSADQSLMATNAWVTCKKTSRYKLEASLRILPGVVQPKIVVKTWRTVDLVGTILNRMLQLFNDLLLALRIIQRLRDFWNCTDDKKWTIKGIKSRPSSEILVRKVFHRQMLHQQNVFAAKCSIISTGF